MECSRIYIERETTKVELIIQISNTLVSVPVDHRQRPKLRLKKEWIKQCGMLPVRRMKNGCGKEMKKMTKVEMMRYCKRGEGYGRDVFY